MLYSGLECPFSGNLQVKDSIEKVTGKCGMWGRVGQVARWVIIQELMAGLLAVDFSGKDRQEPVNLSRWKVRLEESY